MRAYGVWQACQPTTVLLNFVELMNSALNTTISPNQILPEKILSLTESLHKSPDLLNNITYNGIERFYFVFRKKILCCPPA